MHSVFLLLYFATDTANLVPRRNFKEWLVLYPVFSRPREKEERERESQSRKDLQESAAIPKDGEC